MVFGKKNYGLIYILFLLLISPALRSQNITISGYVEDIQSGERIIGAQVIDTINQKIVQTNNFGFFSYKTNKGEAAVKALYLGNFSNVQYLKLVGDTFINFKIKTVTEINEIVVTSDLYNRNANSPLGLVVIPVKQLASVPSLGEIDVLKAIQLQPGIIGGVEGSAGIFVRGGGAGENMFLIDDIPVYNVSHLYGFFSNFNNSAVKDIKLLKGCFPANYGGRVSSIVDVRTRDGNNQKMHGELSAGLISAKFMLEGPIFSSKTTYMISGRRSYLDFFANKLKNAGLMDKSFPKYYFYDINAKVVHTISRGNRLYFSIYNGKDHIQNKKESFEESSQMLKYQESNNETSGWGNLLTSLRWNHNFGSIIFSNTTVAYSTYDFFIERVFSSKEEDLMNDTIISKMFNSKYTSQIHDFITKTDFSFSLNNSNTIKAGIGNTYHIFKPGSHKYSMHNGYLNENADTSFINSDINANESYLFAEDELQLGSKTIINFGIYTSVFSTSDQHFINPQPRITGSYMVTDHLSLKGGYSKMVQYMHLLTSSGLSMPTDVWIPSSHDVKPLESDQVNVGVFNEWKSSFFLSIEMYYKWLYNPTDYKNGVSLNDLQPWYEKTIQGKGKAKGLEISLEKQKGRITGNISYTLSKAERSYADVNNGRFFPFKYDRRHNLNIFGNYQLSAKWDISAAWIYGTGYPATIAVEKYLPALSIYNVDSDFGGEVNYYPSRNNFNMPAYHRLDLSIHYKTKNRLGEHHFSLDIFNVYNRKNPVSMYYSGYRYKKLTYGSLLPMIPSVSYTIKF
jgi:hypothetical protein